jgi:hypothetical protein
LAGLLRKCNNARLALVGALGARAFGSLDRSIVYVALRWGAAVALGWVGLSMSGCTGNHAVSDTASGVRQNNSD